MITHFPLSVKRLFLFSYREKTKKRRIFESYIFFCDLHKPSFPEKKPFRRKPPREKFPQGFYPVQPQAINSGKTRQTSEVILNRITSEFNKDFSDFAPLKLRLIRNKIPQRQQKTPPALLRLHWFPFSANKNKVFRERNNRQREFRVQRLSK